jgi:hypothetical protein
MKKIFSLLVLVLALNFLALGGGVGYLVQSRRLDKAKIGKIREVLFPPHVAAAATQPSPPAPTPSPMNLASLLNEHPNRSVIEQVDFIRKTFDAQMLQMDQRRRELMDLKRQVDLASQKVLADRAALEKREKALTAKEQEAQRLQNDQGFQDALALYTVMPSKQVKTIFMNLSEQTVQGYLTAMDTRTAGKIIKEFKTPDETAFIEKVLERIRQAQVSTTEAK